MTAYSFYIFVVLIVMFFASAIRILREYERGVVFTLGRFWKVKGPGFIIVIPLIQQMVRVDLRTVVMDVPSQDVISRDNVSVNVNAVVYFRVIDPEKSIIQVEDFYEATSQLAQTTLRSHALVIRIAIACPSAMPATCTWQRTSERQAVASTSLTG